MAPRRAVRGAGVTGVTLDAVLCNLERRRLDAERMHATVPVSDVLGTVLIDTAVRALQKAAA